MSSDVLKLARPELMDLIPYTPASYEPDCIRMNANESPYRTLGDNTVRGLNIYPPPRPWALRTRLAAQTHLEAQMIACRSIQNPQVGMRGGKITRFFTAV